MESYHNPYGSNYNPPHNDYPQSAVASSSSSARYRPPANPAYHPPSLYPLHSASSASSASYPPRPPPAQRLPSNMDGLLDNVDAEIHVSTAAPLTTDPNFDIIDWHPAYQSCQRYFLDHAQHEPGTQALCALINIRLPFQWLSNPIQSSTPRPSINTAPSSAHSNSQFTFTPNSYQRANGHHTNEQASHLQTQASAAGQTAPFISLIPYLRRLIITGFDKPPILHGFFGDRYKAGVAPHLDCERRNFLFTAKHGGWRTCKEFYDKGSCEGGDETAPFMKPLEDASVQELEAAERAWGKWLAMEDWMVEERSLREDTAGVRGSQGSGSGSGRGGGGEVVWRTGGCETHLLSPPTLKRSPGVWNARGYLHRRGENATTTWPATRNSPPPLERLSNSTTSYLQGTGNKSTGSLWIRQPPTTECIACNSPANRPRPRPRPKRPMNLDLSAARPDQFGSPRPRQTEWIHRAQHSWPNRTNE